MYTFSFIVGTTIPESVKWIHSATKAMGVSASVMRLGLGGTLAYDSDLTSKPQKL